MATTFQEISLDLLEEGKVKSDLDRRIQDLAKQMVNYVQEHGEAIKGAKGKLTLDIEIVAEEPKAGYYSAVTSFKTRLPAPPKGVSVLMEHENQTDELSLFCRKSGSSKDTPQQKVFCTNDGRHVDIETSEVVDDNGNDSGLPPASFSTDEDMNERLTEIADEIDGDGDGDK